MHSGSLSVDERSPVAFFQAIKELFTDKTISSETLQVILRAPGNEEGYQDIINELGLQNIIFIRPRLNYIDALIEMLAVDGLLLFQGTNCNFQVPAKIYEYFRAKKPIFALINCAGEVASLMRSAKLYSMAGMEDKQMIVEKFSEFIIDLKDGNASVASESFIKKQSRKVKSTQLVDVLDLTLLNK